MDLKAKIIDAAMQLVNLFEHNDDDQFTEIVVEAIYNYDIGALLDLEDALYE